MKFEKFLLSFFFFFRVLEWNWIDFIKRVYGIVIRE